MTSLAAVKLCGLWGMIIPIVMPAIMRGVDSLLGMIILLFLSWYVTVSCNVSAWRLLFLHDISGFCRLVEFWFFYSSLSAAIVTLGSVNAIISYCVLWLFSFSFLVLCVFVWMNSFFLHICLGLVLFLIGIVVE